MINDRLDFLKLNLSNVVPAIFRWENVRFDQPIHAKDNCRR